MDKKVSIIIPIYNGMMFIDNLLDRLLNQTYHNIEIILIDDNSSDASFEKCLSYKAIDDRVKVYHKENSGICNTRNYGIKTATGEYVYFADQDDEPEYNAIEVLARNMEVGIDIVIGGKKIIYVDGRTKKEKIFIYNEKTVYEPDEKWKIFFDNENTTVLQHIWNCIYRVEVLKKNHIFFCERFKYGYEDTVFNAQYIACSNGLKIIGNSVYTYINRSGISTSSKLNIEFYQNFVDYTELLDKWLKISGSFSKEIINYYNLYTFRVGINMYLSNYKFMKFYQRYNNLKKIQLYRMGKNYYKEIYLMDNGTKIRLYIILVNFVDYISGKKMWLLLYLLISLISKMK